MKKLYYWLLALLVLLACSKDFEGELLDTFDFNFTALSSDNALIFEGTEADIRVVPERTISTTRFSFSYSVDEGEGFFQTETGEVIGEQTDVELDSLVFQLTYIPTVIGTHSLTLKAQDQKGNEKEEVITYEVSHAPFTVLLSKGQNTFVINQQNDLNLTVVSDSNTDAIESLEMDGEYNLAFTVEGGTGSFTIGDTEYDPGETIVVNEGTTDFHYTPTVLGEHLITMTATAPDGASRTRELTVDVENVQFFLLANTPSNTVPIGESIDVSLSLQSSDVNDEIDYDLAFFYANDSEGVGTLLDENGSPQNAGEARRIDPGNYTYSFSSDVLGRKKIFFDVSDSNNQVRRDSIELNVTSIPFTFSGQAVGSSTGINQPIELSLSLSTNAPEGSNISYNISFVQSEGNGQLVDTDDQIIPPNTAYDVDPGVFNLIYTPFTLGEHTLLFSATDSFGQSIESEITLMATNAQLSFTASVTNPEIFVGQSNTVSVNLAEQGNTGGLTYEMNYFVTGGTGTLTENGNTVDPSQFFTTQLGSRTFTFTPDIPGSYTLTFGLRDSNGQTLDATASFVVSNTNFQFTATEANAEIGLGQNNNINFTIIPGTTNNGTTYTMTYTATNNGTLSIGGVPFGPGQTITVQEGSFQGIYNPTRTGSYTLDFTVNDSNGVTRTDSATFNVTNSDFTINAAANPSQINASESSTINIDVNQLVANPAASYELSYSVTGGSGTISGPGGTLQPGVFAPIGIGSSSYVYSPSTEGSHVITFVVRDNSGATREENVIIEVIGRDFNLTAIATSGTSNIGEGVPVNLNIEELGGTGGTYSVVVASTGNGTINYNGNTFTLGEAFTVNGGASSFTYTGTSTGTHNLTITATASYGPIKTANETIAFNSLEYTFTAAAQNSTITVGETTLINFNISEAVGNSTYEMRFTLSGQNASLSQNGSPRNAGILYPVNVGNFSYNITGVAVGTVNLQFTVTNVNGLERVQNVSINVVTRDYTFTATEAQSVANVGEPTNITLNIQESVAGIDTYTAVYSSTGTGTLTYNGQTIIPGNTFTVPAGSSSGSYVGTSGGTHDIQFTVTSSSGTQRSDNARIAIETNDFTFTATEQSANANLGETVGISFNIGETVPGVDTYTAIYTNSNNGTFNYNGQQIAPGQSFTITAGNTSGTYTAQNSGNHRLDFTVTSSSGASQSDRADISFDANEFTFVATPEQLMGNLDQPLTINFELNESIPGIDTYTMRFSNSNTGVFVYNGQTHNPGASFTFQPGSSSATYTTTSVGTHNINFTVTSSSGADENDNISLEFDVPFTFDVTASDTTVDTTPNPFPTFTLDIQGTRPGASYQWSYTSSLGNIRNPNNTGIDFFLPKNTLMTISEGSTSFEFTSATAGNTTFEFTVIDDLGNNVTDDINITFQTVVPLTIELRAVIFNQGSIIETNCGPPFNSIQRTANVDFGYVIQAFGDGIENVTAIQFREFPGQPTTTISPTSYTTPSGTVSNVFLLNDYEDLTRYFTNECGTNDRPSLGSQAALINIGNGGTHNYLFDGGSFQVNVLVNGLGQGFENLIGDTDPPLADTN